MIAPPTTSSVIVMRHEVEVADADGTRRQSQPVVLLVLGSDWTTDAVDRLQRYWQSEIPNIKCVILGGRDFNAIDAQNDPKLTMLAAEFLAKIESFKIRSALIVRH